MEKIFIEKTLQRLAKNFHIQTEVLGTHFSDSRLRIDAIVRPKNISGWKNPNVSFGIEFKSEEKLNSTKDRTHWIKQCIDYANTEWDGHGYIYIFSCPSIFTEPAGEANSTSWLWNRVLSNLGVGRLEEHKHYGWTFYLQDRHRIWSEKDGVISGKNWDLIRKFGRDSFKYI